jgi:hypothetical protein
MAVDERGMRAESEEKAERRRREGWVGWERSLKERDGAKVEATGSKRRVKPRPPGIHRGIVEYIPRWCVVGSQVWLDTKEAWEVGEGEEGRGDKAQRCEGKGRRERR